MRRNRLGKVCLLLMLMLMLEMRAGLAGNEETNSESPRVMVYVVQDNFKVDCLGRAEQTARKIFAAIGVPIAFHLGAKRKSGEAAAVSIEMQFHSRVPADFHPGALAYASPFRDAGVRIHVFCDRVLNPTRDQGTGAFLGHVMAHEIAHVLEAADHHSAEGVMKARWETADFQQMLTGLLPFDSTDAGLIYAALGQRATRSRAGQPQVP